MTTQCTFPMCLCSAPHDADSKYIAPWMSMDTRRALARALCPNIARVPTPVNTYTNGSGDLGHHSRPWPTD